MARLIFFCSPFAGQDEQRNIVWAQDSCREILKAGAVPFAPHLLYPTFLDDRDPAQRERGIHAGIEIMARSDEVWFYVPPWRRGFSPGMLKEWETAKRLEKHVVVIGSHDEWEDHLARLRKLTASPPLA